MTEMDRDELAAREATIAAIRHAIRKANEGAPVDEVCGFCGNPLVVEGLPPGGPYSQWLIHCPCGRSDTLVKGL
jgi:hypothetical protein